MKTYLIDSKEFSLIQQYKDQLINQNKNYYNPPTPAPNDHYTDNNNRNRSDEEMPNPNDKAAMQAWLIKKRAEMKANQACWKIMQDISLRSHVISMNIIEGIGGGDGYWKITNDPW